MCRETKEYKISVEELTEELKIAVLDCFVAKVVAGGSDMRITFDNGQTFHIAIGEEK